MCGQSRSLVQVLLCPVNFTFAMRGLDDSAMAQTQCSPRILCRTWRPWCLAILGFHHVHLCLGMIGLPNCAQFGAKLDGVKRFFQCADDVAVVLLPTFVEFLVGST